MIENRVLTDQTVVMGAAWHSVKHYFMSTTFSRTRATDSWKPEEKDLLERLVRAQRQQGDMKRLQPQPFLPECSLDILEPEYGFATEPHDGDAGTMFD